MLLYKCKNCPLSIDFTGVMEALRAKIRDASAVFFQPKIVSELLFARFAQDMNNEEMSTGSGCRFIDAMKRH